jgi:hypothetical protein
MKSTQPWVLDSVVAIAVTEAARRQLKSSEVMEKSGPRHPKL